MTRKEIIANKIYNTVVIAGQSHSATRIIIEQFGSNSDECIRVTWKDNSCFILAGSGIRGLGIIFVRVNNRKITYRIGPFSSDKNVFHWPAANENCLREVTEKIGEYVKNYSFQRNS